MAEILYAILRELEGRTPRDSTSGLAEEARDNFFPLTPTEPERTLEELASFNRHPERVLDSLEPSQIPRKTHRAYGRSVVEAYE